MKGARKVFNAHGEVYFKQKQRLTIAFAGNTLPHRNQSRKGAEDLIIGVIACHQRAILPKLTSPTTLPRNHNQ